jgi:hypothetical protein
MNGTVNEAANTDTISMTGCRPNANGEILRGATSHDSECLREVVMSTCLNQMLERLRAEYLEMPGLRLTPKQVQRLCGVEGTICQMVLDALVDEQFLRVNRDGTYGRLAEGHHPRPTEASLSARGLRCQRSLENAEIWTESIEGEWSP